MSTVLAIAAGYFALLLLLSVIVRPKRQRLAVVAHELLRLDLKPEHERAIKGMLSGAYSMRSAPATVLGILIALLTPSKTFDRQAHEWAKTNPEVVGDRRWSEMFNLYYASIAAVNPIFGVLLYAMRVLFRLKAYLFIIRHYPRTEHLAKAEPAPKLEPKPKDRLEELEIFGEVKVAITA